MATYYDEGCSHCGGPWARWPFVMDDVDETHISITTIKTVEEEVRLYLYF